MEGKISRSGREKKRGDTGSDSIDAQGSTMSSFMIPITEYGRSKLFSEPSVRKLTKAETAAQKAKEENEERKDRRLDMTELQAIWEKNMNLMKELIEAKLVQAKWDRYMRCDGSPDPVNQKEINTYISLRQEDTSRDNAECVLLDSQMDLQLIQELQFLLLNTPLDEEDKVTHQRTIEKLRKLIVSKLNMATLHVMCEATVLAHKETGNLEYAASIGDIALCIWGNIMKNPRIRSFEFTEINFSFDIPKTLALTDCAVRILTTKFDNYSPTSKTILPRLIKVEESVELEVKEEKKEEEEEEKEQDGGNKEPSVEETEDLPVLKLKMFPPSSTDVAEDTEGRDEDMQVELEEDYPDPPTPEPDEWEEFKEDEDVIDLRAFGVLGRIYHFDLLQLPPQPRLAGSWTITQLVDPPEINFLEYTVDTAGTQDGGRDGKKDEKPPISVNVTLPDDVISFSQPQVARWDKDRQLWTTKGIMDIAYTEEINLTYSLGMDQRNYQLHGLRDTTKILETVLLVTGYFDSSELRKGELCCLKEPNKRPELNSILNKWASPSELIRMMTKAGLNFFPSEDSFKFVNIQRKHPIVEERLYQQMALTVSAMAYAWSKWNRLGADNNEIIFMGAESLGDQPVPEEAWTVFMATKRRITRFLEGDDLKEPGISELSYMISEEDSAVVQSSNRPSKVPHLRRAVPSKTQRRSKMKEELKTPREQFLEMFAYHRSQFKSNIYHLIASSGNEAAMARINNTSFQFVNCVYKLLTATRILTYS